MIGGVLEEVRQIVREMPAFAGAFLLLVAMCVGVHGAVFYEADGEQLKLIADGNANHASLEHGNAIARMRERAECSMRKTPGITVIVGLRQYDVELSVSVASVRALFENAQMNVVGACVTKGRGTA